MRHLNLAVVIAFFCSGCATFMEEKHVREENLDILDLKKAFSETNLKIEELNNKFMLLQEKVESEREKTVKPPKETSPPEGLKVVKLKEEETSAPVSKGPEELYGRAQDFFLSGNYARARELFGELVNKFPSSDLADNSLYWVGESYYSEGDYKNSLLKFKEAADKYPEGNKAPDALLKAAFSYMELGENKNGADTLGEVVRRYPQSEAAEKAKKKLK